MEVNEFKNDHFSCLSENLLGKKSKSVILMGDFNGRFQITTPTNLSLRSKTLIDNIFTTHNTEDTISGNILTTISGHLARFIFYPIEQL